MNAIRQKTDCPVTVHMREDEARTLMAFLYSDEVAKLANEGPFWCVWNSLYCALENELGVE
jgi:hypothetical protein